MSALASWVLNSSTAAASPAALEDKESEDFWAGKSWEKEPEYTELCRRHEEAAAVWQELCLEWYAVWSREEIEENS